MDDIDALIKAIAKDKLGIQTLDTRGRDSLDFHEVSVSSLKDALKAAYAAGQESAEGKK